MDALAIKTRKEFYNYLKDNHLKINECFVYVKTGDPKNAKGILSYIDAVEVALCFGFIDSTKKIIKGKLLQRFSPRKNTKNWTILNIARVKRLIQTKEMTDFGLKVCPDLNKEYQPPKKILNVLKQNKDAYNFFISTPKLYQNIRLSYIDNFKTNKEKQKSLKILITKCLDHKLYGSWNDYGRLN